MKMEGHEESTRRKGHSPSDTGISSCPLNPFVFFVEAVSGKNEA
jgi:hypothetical protein